MSVEVVAEKLRFRIPLVIVANLALVLHLVVYALGSFPEFDANARLKLYAGILVALGVAAAAFRVQRTAAIPVIDQERWHTPLVVGASLVLLAFGWFALPTGMYTSLAHVHILLTFMLSCWILYGILFDGSQPLRRVRLWVTVGVIGVIVISLIRVYGLSVYPFVDVQDEAWTTAWALNWVRTGRFGDPLLGGLGDAYYAYPRFYWLMGTWLRLVGVGLWQGRFFSFLLIIPLIGITLYVARAWYGRRAALFTGAFMFCSAVLLSAARIRHDIGLALCLAGSIALFTLAAKRRSPFLHFFAGFVMVCGMFSHYHGAGLSVVVFVGLYAPRYFAQWRNRAAPRFWLPESGAWLYAFGAILGFVAVLGIQMIPDDLPGWLWTFRHQSLYSTDSREFFISLFGNIFNIAWFSVFEFILVAAAVVMALRRRTLYDVSLLLILALGFLVLAIMGSGAIYYYILPLVPVYSLLVGRMFVGTPRATEQPNGILSRQQVVTAAFFLLPLLAATSGRSLQAVLDGEPIQARAPLAVQWIRDHVPPQDEVVADMYYYLWLNDYHFTSHLVEEYMYPENIERYPTFASAWDAVDMDYLVIDPNFDRSYRKYFLPLLATGLIDAKYTVAAEIPSPAGTITIYQRRADAS